MIRVEHVEPVGRPVEHVFDVVVRHQADNHPRWEKEVLEVRPLDAIDGVGHRSVMVRREGGRVREVVNECVEYVEGRRVAYRHDDSAMDFLIAFDFVPVGPEAASVGVTVRMDPHGALRLLTPVLRLGAPRRTARITASMRRVIEETPAYV